MGLALHTDPIDGEQLVSSLQSSVPVSDASLDTKVMSTKDTRLTWDDPGYVDWRVLLFAPHHVEA